MISNTSFKCFVILGIQPILCYLVCIYCPGVCQRRVPQCRAVLLWWLYMAHTWLRYRADFRRALPLPLLSLLQFVVLSIIQTSTFRLASLPCSNSASLMCD